MTNRYKNFVPEGEDNSTSKRPLGQRQPNFVPGPDFVEVPRGNADEQFLEASAAAKARREKAKQQRWDNALEFLAKNATHIITQFLSDLPVAQREMYLLAEELTQNRREVLQYFPAAGPTAREVWSQFASAHTGELKPRAEAVRPTPKQRKPK